MDFRRPIKLLIIMALIIYFMCKIFNAEMKLGEGRIGTMITTIHSDTVQGNHQIVIVAPKILHVPSFIFQSNTHGSPPSQGSVDLQ